MATAREESHALIERMSEEKVKDLLEQARAEVEQSHNETLEWLEQARQVREGGLCAKYGEITDSVIILDEVRKERLNDLMGTGDLPEENTLP